MPTNRAVLFTSSEKLRQTFFSWFDESASRFSVMGLGLWPEDVFELTYTDKFNEEVIAAYSRSENCVPKTIKYQFDFHSYQQSLTSKAFGHIAVYADIIGTTMTVFDGLTLRYPESFSVVAIARQQTKGQGRSGNKWLSPVGCAMFTLVVAIPMKSKLGQSLPILQHLTSVAVAHSVRSLPGLQEVNIGVKWPNDIYFGSEIKLGGVVVKSTMFKNNCIASIGCGVNICNEKPTVCVNQILKENYNKSDVLSCEQVIARTLTILEALIDDFQQNGPQGFLEMYYKYWIHSGANVKVQRDRHSSEKLNALVIGIDECGYLRVRLDDGSITTLNPDGNSFDLTKNLIIAKS
uniref:Biotin--protein ligase n=1 Tax=Phallusia mammillata TaxID=59560 RepID=A0A6F9DFA7_9ASCI|nr:biotin--protein ligase [Phallusia mammillata]